MNEPLLGDSVDDPLCPMSPSSAYETERGFSHSLARLRGRNVYWTLSDNIVRSTTPEGVVKEVGRGHAGAGAVTALDRSHSTNGGLCSPLCGCELSDSAPADGSPGVDATGQGRPVDGGLKGIPNKICEFCHRWPCACGTWAESPIYPAASKVYDKALALLCSKHGDYGPRNVSEAPGGPLNGLRVRIHDKTARINNLLDSGASPENESLRDSFVDLLNYAAISLLVLDGDWPA